MIVDVGAVEEFPVRDITVIDVGDRSIGIAHWDGEFYALRNVCPHLAAPVCGLVKARLVANDDPEPFLDVTQPVVSCSWHRWEFRLTDGRCLHDDRLRISLYPVTVAGGRVSISLPDS